MKMHKILGFLILFTFVFSVNTVAQNPVRVEFRTDIEEDSFGCIPFNDSLFVIGSSSDGKSETSKIWNIGLYDKYLEKVRSYNVELSEDLTYIDYAMDDENIYMLLYNRDRKKRTTESFVLVYNISDSKLLKYPVVLPSKRAITQFRAQNMTMMVAVENTKGLGELLFYNLKEGNDKKVETGLTKKGIVGGLSCDNGKYVAVFRDEPSNQENALRCNFYDLSGSMINSVSIDHPTSGILFNEGEYFPLSNNKGIVAGTFFRNRKGKNQSNQHREGELSTGIFIASFENEKLMGMRFHSFADLENLYVYLTDNNYASMSKAVSQRKKEKEGILTHFALLMHDIVEFNGELILVAETYSPEYRQERRYNYDYYGRVYPTYYQVFEGYRFNNAIVIGMNQDGDVLWNNGMQFKDVVSNRLEEKASLSTDSTGMFMSYIDQGKLLTKYFMGSLVNQQTYVTELELKYKTDMLSLEKDAELRHWYNNYYYSSGFQTIKNNSMKDGRKRNVFYVSKLILK